MHHKHNRVYKIAGIIILGIAVMAGPKLSTKATSPVDNKTPLRSSSAEATSVNPVTASTTNSAIASTVNSAIASTVNAATASTANAAIASTANSTIASTTNAATASTANAAISSTVNAAIASTANAAKTSTANSARASTTNATKTSTANSTIKEKEDNNSPVEPRETVLAYVMHLFSSNEDTNENVKLACKKIDGTVIQPGEIFSYNDTLGTRTIENGFVMAPSYYGKETEETVGGGICRVSTALYRTCLRSGLSIVERHSHTKQVNYAQGGLDAAVTEGEQDFRFKNNFNVPVTIHAICDEHHYRVTITTVPSFSVNYKYSPRAEKIEDGIYKSFLDIYDINGKLIETRRLDTTWYWGSRMVQEEAEAAKTGTTKTDTAKTDTTKTGTTKTESTKTDTTKTDTTKTNTTKADTAKTESTKADTAKTESTKAGTTKAGTTKTNTTKNER